MPEPVLERSYDDGEVRFTLTVDSERETAVVVRGRGTMAGAHEMLRFLDEAVARLGSDGASRFYFDVSGVRGAPLRTQLMFGKWFFKHRRLVGRAVVVGAGPVERRVATAVVGMAGVRNFRFFERADEARGWLMLSE